MDLAELRSRIKKYIEHADERVLRIFNAIMEVETNDIPDPVTKAPDSHLKQHRDSTDNEKSQEEGMGSLKDDHRLK